MVEAQLTLIFHEKQVKEIMKQVLEVDNPPKSTGLSCSLHGEGEKYLEYTIRTQKGITSLRATLDDLLFSADLVLSVLDKLGAPRRLGSNREQGRR